MGLACRAACAAEIERPSRILVMPLENLKRDGRSLSSAETAEAHLVLGESYPQSKDLPAARAEAERALVLDPASDEARRLLDMLRSPKA